jgi:hypothetical protein
MNWRIWGLMIVGLSLAASTTAAVARWRRSDNCKAPLEGAAIGKGILGLGSERAREAARDNWEAAAEDRYGRAFSNMDRAISVRWDCKKGAVVTAKCVVVARPCASRISG